VTRCTFTRRLSPGGEGRVPNSRARTAIPIPHPGSATCIPRQVLCARARVPPAPRSPSAQKPRDRAPGRPGPPAPECGRESGTERSPAPLPPRAAAPDPAMTPEAERATAPPVDLAALEPGDWVFARFAGARGAQGRGIRGAAGRGAPVHRAPRIRPQSPPPAPTCRSYNRHFWWYAARVEAVDAAAGFADVSYPGARAARARASPPVQLGPAPAAAAPSRSC
jgi:hypothetical protein